MPISYKMQVSEYITDTLPHRWIGRASQSDSSHLIWLPWSPNLTPHDIFVWCYVKVMFSTSLCPSI
ncbi:hypothetical protein C0J52_16027 [Blattella germanica]|nr:hypothetical protein C0J52_16027 [Blattella germanica]